MTTSSKRKVVPALKSSSAVRQPARRVAAAKVPASRRALSTAKPIAKGKARPGARVLLSGQTRTERRTLGVALAADVERDLYCVDLSRVVSKYIGETEKNLARVFALAEATRAVLFLDEADALFGRRTDVQDSHDRYANAGTKYLLTRMETYPGLVILATNQRENLDEAFLRRLRFTTALKPSKRRKAS